MPARSKRVLIADDQKDAIEMSALVLRLSGYEVEVAFSGREAFRAAWQLQADVVFLDIGMDGLTGWDVARRLRRLRWTQPPILVAVTSYGRDEDRRRSKEAGFDIHLTKPADITEMERIVRTRTAV
jgi:CheY-like chemotaxis protein